jgi:hypothetical protein
MIRAGPPESDMSMACLFPGISTAALLSVAALAASARVSAAAEPEEFFERKVRPVLVQHCFRCHSAREKKKRGGLHLDSRSAILKGGDSGPAIVPGDPDRSRLIEALRYTNVDLQMPPRGKLPATVVNDLAAWIKQSAPWPETTASAPGDKEDKFDLQKRKRHWAWKPVQPSAPPAVKDPRWPTTPIDRFLLARLEQKGLVPAPAADRATLLRRLSFDLIGLPPSPDEIKAFLGDRSPKATARAVDRLLASPRFGERWGRHWLDLVRYAETRGHEFDPPIPNAYQYRDYVIRAFNEDVPYNQFVLEHIAGDLLSAPRLSCSPRPYSRREGLGVRGNGFNESILGTGFWFLGEEVHSPVDVRSDQADRFDNRIDVMSKTFLGLTVACARCHDHKFDAISTKDYYALFGFLESSSYRQVRFDAWEHNRQLARQIATARQSRRRGIQRTVAALLQPGIERTADYLLAAREVIQTWTPVSNTAAAPSRQHLQASARKRKLDSRVLESWVAHLLAAVRDSDDPLHAFALLSAADNGSSPMPLVKRLQPLLERGKRRQALVGSLPKQADVVVDFARLSVGQWLPDDVSFGAGPVVPGELQLHRSAENPRIHFVAHRAAAVIDPLWNGQRLARGAENEPGALGRMVRWGRTIRTPTFRLQRDKLFYLVRGSGMAYASIGAHVMISGPLHGRLVEDLPDSRDFRWVEQDLRAYKGQLAHVEFTAAADKDFAVALVVQAERMPEWATTPPAMGPLLRLLGGVSTPEELAQGCQRLFLNAAKRLDSDRIRGACDAREQAALLNWLLRKGELFGLDQPKTWKQNPVIGSALREEARLAALAARESRLAPAMRDGTGVDEQVFLRGSYKTLGGVVPRRFLEALAGPERLAVSRGSGRLELARQMTDPQMNPFLARVMVNRVWHHLFGRGIVASVDNFGVLGEAPTHPQLLDYLASRFVRDGWSIKKLIRQIVLSRAYQMASVDHPDAGRIDPRNLLLHRMPRHRLQGEAIRDALLAISGRLDTTMYGPSVPVHLSEFQQGRGRPASGPLDGAGRRSVYLAVRRNFLSSLLLAFDTPSPFSTVGRRTVSNVPAQSLILMNEPFIHQQARLWAKRVLAERRGDEERIESMYLAAFGRRPASKEVDACLEFIREQDLTRGRKSEPLNVWTDLAHALINVKEFIFLR